MTMRSCSLLSLATAVPPYVIEQSEAKACGRQAFGGKKQLFDRLSSVFDNAGIARRHLVAPQDWYLATHGWQDRNAVYLEASEQLFIEASTAAIEKAGLRPDQIDGIRIHYASHIEDVLAVALPHTKREAVEDEQVREEVLQAAV